MATFNQFISGIDDVVAPPPRPVAQCCTAPANVDFSFVDLMNGRVQKLDDFYFRDGLWVAEPENIKISAGVGFGPGASSSVVNCEYDGQLAQLYQCVSDGKYYVTIRRRGKISTNKLENIIASSLSIHLPGVKRIDGEELEGFSHRWKVQAKVDKREKELEQAREREKRVHEEAARARVRAEAIRAREEAQAEAARVRELAQLEAARVRAEAIRAREQAQLETARARELAQLEAARVRAEANRAREQARLEVAPTETVQVSLTTETKRSYSEKEIERLQKHDMCPYCLGQALPLSKYRQPPNGLPAYLNNAATDMDALIAMSNAWGVSSVGSIQKRGKRFRCGTPGCWTEIILP